MGIHIKAAKGAIAETVLLPGDPQRAKWIAETFLTDIVCYNTVRGMLGYTGTAPDGRRVSVQGAGMGMASLGIYVHELITDFDVKRIIRVGSAGSLDKNLACRSIALVQASCSDSAMNANRFPPGVIFAPIADWSLLINAYQIAGSLGIPVEVVNNFATDLFYDDARLSSVPTWQTLAKFGVQTVEMESAELYTLAAFHKIQALTILTISDNLVTGEKLTPDERATGFSDMVNIALAL